MAWLDIIVGSLFGLLITIALSRLFISRPKTTILVVILVVLMGLMLSDNFLTTRDAQWNVIDKIRAHFMVRKNKI